MRNEKFDEYLRYLVVDICDKAFGTNKKNGEHGWSEAQLADRAGLAKSTIYKLRTGVTHDPRFRTIWKLIGAVGINKKLIMREMAEVAKL